MDLKVERAEGIKGKPVGIDAYQLEATDRAMRSMLRRDSGGGGELRRILTGWR